MSQTTVKCPNCQQPVIWQASSQYRPFCSKRCQLIDLGEWANESHKIAGKPGFSDNPELLDVEDVEQLLQQQPDDFFNN